LAGGLCAPADAAEQEPLIARVLEDYILKTNSGELIEIADTDMGEDLQRHVGKMVEVFGKITGRKGARTIRVFSYNLITE